MSKFIKFKRTSETGLVRLNYVRADRIICVDGREAGPTVITFGDGDSFITVDYAPHEVMEMVADALKASMPASDERMYSAREVRAILLDYHWAADTYMRDNELDYVDTDFLTNWTEEAGLH